MDKSRIISVILIIIIFLFVGVTTMMKVYENHQKKLILVVEKRLEEAARKCVIDEKCDEGEKITLGALIAKEYLESQVHPISKEYLSEEILIDCKNYVCIARID